MYALDVAFVLLVLGAICAYRLYGALRWVVDLRRHRRARKGQQ